MLLETLSTATGIAARNTSNHAFFVKSAEIPLTEDSFMYLEELKDSSEKLCGYRLAFCFLIHEMLQKLTESDYRQIIQTFANVKGKVQKSVTIIIGSPYSREDLTTSKGWDNRRFQKDATALWVDVNFIGADITVVRKLILKYKKFAEEFKLQQIVSVKE